MILTSYFNKTHPIYGRMYNHPNAWGIARRSYCKRTYEDLMPPKDLLDRYNAGLVTPEEYAIEFKARRLVRLDPRDVINEVGEDVVLLCSCGPGKFCHRHLVAAWLKQAGFMVEEVRA